MLHVMRGEQDSFPSLPSPVEVPDITAPIVVEGPSEVSFRGYLLPGQNSSHSVLERQATD